MNNSALKNTTIGDLVNQNNIRAYVLYYLGIKFYEYSEHTLEQVCEEKSLRLEQVVRELESPSENFQEDELPLISYPIDLIIEFLKHAHFLYVKYKLPYIARLVESFKANHKDYDAVERDLKTVFPLFLEDFIHHIYEEEDTLFRYIKTLERAQKVISNPSKLYYMIERSSLQKFAMEHEAHDDEMEGIRRITKDYHLVPSAPLHVKVIFSELIEFEKSLKTHARIENEILFPKAMALENTVKQAFFEKVKFN
ncbi:MAG: hemerythrin domain-containing protein [Bacteroidia bacterium]|nr:hemerythrin domain-containing protein [Bacteroidia bacterium]